MLSNSREHAAKKRNVTKPGVRRCSLQTGFLRSGLTDGAGSMPTDPLTQTADGSMAGQVALITGGSKGLGQLLANALARAGASVVITGRSLQPLEEAASSIAQAGGKVLPLVCDVSNAEAVKTAVQRAQEAVGPIDILVNNAGQAGPIDKAWRTDPTEWWQTFEVNLYGSFLCMHAVLPKMVERERGIIINVASQAGVHRWPNCSAYAVSKSAVIKLTENLAAETWRQGLSLFAYHPGLLPIGMKSERDDTLAPGSPAERVWSWANELVQSGKGTSPERSVAQLMKLASGRYPGLSGCYLTVHDDLDAMNARMAGDDRRKDLYRLRLLE